jgi:monovalent cation:H+ antiporter, CPA1 family
MSLFAVVAVVVVLSALFSYINARRIHLPATISLMLMSLVMALGLILLSRFSPWGGAIEKQARHWVQQVHFSRVLLHGMLGFLLFAGALRVDLEGLFVNRWPIGALATAGVIASTAVVGLLTWLVLRLLGIGLPLSYCLLFGALISPTDPISVLHIFRSSHVPRNVEATIAGESLFNDGVGVVIFGVLLNVVESAHVGGSGFGLEVAVTFAREAGGGMALGLAVGYLAFLLLRGVDSYPVEILITLAVVMGGYALADALAVSGPLAMVVAGILIGSRGRALAMSQKTRENLDVFWEVIDELLNAVLFVFIGLEAMVLTLRFDIFLAGAALVPVVLAARLASAGLLTSVLSRHHHFPRGTWFLVTCAGLRGAISVAMALSLASGRERTVIVSITYIIVVFTILVQGLTMPRVVAGLGERER